MRTLVRAGRALAAACVLCFVLASAQAALAVSPNVVISQVYGGAGCGTAGCSTYQNDFIELFNRGTTPVSVNGWSVQYAAAAGTSWQVTVLTNFTLQPGQYYLVAESSSANGVNPLPTPDASGTIAMSATAAKVALVNTTTALSGACPTGAQIVDLVGYGATATCFEGAGPAPAPSTTTADIRKGAGRIDTDNNNLDFDAATPTPRNSASPTVSTAPAPLIISEFRLRGQNGATDEFVEIYNNSNADAFVFTLDGSSGFALVASDGTTRFTVPNGTTVPARGHYLGVNSAGYSLANYGGTGAAAGDATYTTDIPDNFGIALFKTATAANFNTNNRLDAVGSNVESNTLYREGTGYPALIPFSIEYSFYRDLRGGTPKDTGDNAADFVFVDTQFTDAGAPTHLGAPGPENLSSPVQRNATIKATFIDPGCTGTAAAPTQACPRYRDPTPDPANNSTLGTLSIRRRFVNNTGQSVTRLRFRIVDITTAPQASGNGTADLRARTSTDQTAICQGAGLGCSGVGATVTINGTTLEQPPAQPQGGGYNSTLSAGTINLANQLANGASINVQFLLGVQQGGNYRFFINVEALPGGPGFAQPAQAPKVSGVKAGGGSKQ
ncbi:MAG TPA: lamin tail domain-containing protein [Pyrinomonadaceae bacterium]|jgi:hypothetical protein